MTAEAVDDPAAPAERWDIEREIDAIAITRTQWTVFLLTAAVMFVDGFDLQALSLAVPYMAREWGVDPPAFSFALSSSLIGMAIGGGLFAPLGDRIGRKPMLVAALLLVGASTLAIGFVGAIWQVTALRLVTGIALGIVAVNSLSLTGEYAPARKRFLVMTLTSSTIALGAFSSAFVAPAIILGQGWRALFVIGGLGALLLAAGFATRCPESIKWLLARRPADRRIAPIARRILPGIHPESLYASIEQEEARASVFALLSPRHRTLTLTIWVANACGGFSLYMMISWLPTLLLGVGWSDTAASWGAGAVQLGSMIGGLIMAMCVDRGLLLRALLCGYGAAIASLVGIALLPGQVALWMVFLAAIGAGTGGMQVIWIAIANAFLPLNLRSTSAGWTSAVSRIGAVSAPFAGGAAMAAGVGASGIMLSLIVPVSLSATVLLLSRRHLDRARLTRVEEGR